jgi:hypothetical protein
MLEGLPEGHQHLQLVGHSGCAEEKARGVKGAVTMGRIYGLHG